MTLMCLYHGQDLLRMQEQSDTYDARQSHKILPRGRCGGDHLLRSGLRERERDKEGEGENKSSPAKVSSGLLRSQGHNPTSCRTRNLPEVVGQVYFKQFSAAEIPLKKYLLQNHSTQNRRRRNCLGGSKGGSLEPTHSGPSLKTTYLPISTTLQLEKLSPRERPTLGCVSR